ncbi:MAG: ChbG/HpnK family deacetylase [Planctomycetes bacterium]|nr:ChbG/HpnK family deacetylase [Planctomycetota bacterium]
MTARLIVTADDYGLAREVDDGIVDLVAAGCVTAVSVLVNRPCAPDLSRLGGVAPGLHLDLTLGQPASSVPVPSLVGGDGAFRGDAGAQLEALDLADVAREWRAQLAAFQALAGRAPAHLDVHKHLHARDGRLLELVLELARPHRIPVRSLDAGMRTRCRAAGVPAADHFLGGVEPGPYWTPARLCAALARLPDGITELMCHPGRGVVALPGLAYASERNAERDAFLHEDVGAALARCELAGFAAAFAQRKASP